jgi:hypothetical protein
MGSPETLRIPIGETKPFFTPDGSTVSLATRFSPVTKSRFVKPGNTALHEGGHTLLALEEGIGVERVTIVPEGDSLGSTSPDSFSAVAAAGGKASDTGGWRWDEMLVEARGMSFSKAETRARAKLRALRQVHYALSSAIEEKGTLTRAEINEEYRNAKNAGKQDSNKDVTYDVFIKTKDGAEETVRLEVPKGATMLHVPLPVSGDIYDTKKDSFRSDSVKDF